MDTPGKSRRPPTALPALLDRVIVLLAEGKAGNRQLLERALGRWSFALSLGTKPDKLSGSCRYGKTEFHIEADTPAQLTHGTCSVCAKHGDLLAHFEPAQFHVIPLSDDAVHR